MSTAFSISDIMALHGFVAQRRIFAGGDPGFSGAEIGRGSELSACLGTRLGRRTSGRRALSIAGGLPNTGAMMQHFRCRPSTKIHGGGDSFCVDLRGSFLKDWCGRFMLADRRCSLVQPGRQLTLTTIVGRISANNMPISNAPKMSAFFFSCSRRHRGFGGAPVRAGSVGRGIEHTVLGG